MPNAQNIRTLYQSLGETIADIIGHPDCPEVVCDELGKCLENIINATDVSSVPNFARFLLVPALSELTEAANTQSKAT